MILDDIWNDCWQGIGAQGDGQILMRRLLKAHNEADRKYHTEKHLRECLGLFDEYRDCAEKPAEVGIALWFHDAVYDVKASSNERVSAEWAERELLSAGVRPLVVQRIYDLVMATEHSSIPEGQDQQLIVDIDLAILGADPERFWEYERQVREEYQFIPSAIFNEKRMLILATLLGRSSIYSTKEFEERFEIAAQHNLVESIGRLESNSA